MDLDQEIQVSSVPTPSGFEDFGSGDSDYHSYDVTRPLGDADPDCVMQQLINNSVPNNPNGGVRPATPEGTPNIAYIPIIGTDNHVTSYLAKNLSGPGMVAVNMTGSGSTFSPGYVARTVSDGVAHTYGEGTSPIQSSLGLDNLSGNPLGALNNVINERVWGKQMEEFISKAKKDVAVDTSQSMIFRTPAEVIGCLVAPIPVVALGVAQSILYTSFDALTVLVFSLIAYFISLVITMLPGYPLYRLLVRFNAFRWWTSILSGFAIGSIATVLIAHPTDVMSSGVLVNSLATATSGLLFWIIQQTKYAQA